MLRISEEEEVLVLKMLERVVVSVAIFLPRRILGTEEATGLVRFAMDYVTKSNLAIGP